MRRMISQKLQDILKKLSVATWADNDGNLEVGKNLTVDGNITCNGYIEDSDGNNYISDNQTTSLFQHTVTIHNTTLSEDYTAILAFTGFSDKATKIDSIQDLIDVFANTDFAVTGTHASKNDPLFIHVGTTIANTYIYVASVALDEKYTFTEYFGTSGFILDDSPTRTGGILL